MTHKIPDEQKMQEKYMEYTMYKSQLDALAKELSLINSTTNNLAVAKDTLESVGKMEKSSEIMVPVGGNAFLKADLKDTDNVLVGIGADIILKKKIPDALETFRSQLAELDETRSKIEAQIHNMDAKMNELEPALQQMGESLRQKAEAKKKK